jgi:hypothetical protein
MFFRYGSEIAYLSQALTGAKKAHDIARKGKVSGAVQHDVEVGVSFTSLRVVCGLIRI